MSAATHTFNQEWDGTMDPIDEALRMQCLQLAVSLSHGEPSDIVVRDAQAFFEFVKCGGRASGAEQESAADV